MTRKGIFQSYDPRPCPMFVICCGFGELALPAAALHQRQRALPELQQLLAGPGVALGAPPAPWPGRSAAPAPALPAAPSGHRRQLPEGRSRTRRGFCVRRHAACAWRRSSAAGFYRGGGSLAPCPPRKRRKQVITGGECASLNGTNISKVLPIIAPIIPKEKPAKIIIIIVKSSIYNTVF